MPPTDLAGLLERAALRDIDAFSVFYDRTIGSARLLARITTTDPADVDDVVRRAYLDAWRECDSFRGTGLSAQAWLMFLVQRNALMVAPRSAQGRRRARLRPHRVERVGDRAARR